MSEVHDDRLPGEALPSLDTFNVTRTAKAIREWTRAVLAPPALIRMYNMGMGIERFDQPTALGNIVRVEAPPAVQQRALQSILTIAVPGQVGLSDDDGNTLPGVLALGPLELDEARQETHGERYVSAEDHARLVAQHHLDDPNATDAPAPSMRPMSERIKAGEFQMVEVIEGVDAAAPGDTSTEPPVLDTTITPEQKVLANRRARKQGERIPFPDME